MCSKLYKLLCDHGGRTDIFLKHASNHIVPEMERPGNLSRGSAVRSGWWHLAC